MAVTLAMNLQQKILGVTFENPTVLASGILGITASNWKHLARCGTGAITTKSLWPVPHQGNKNPTIISTEHWTLNAVGVPDAGPEKAKEEIGAYMEWKPAEGPEPRRRVPLIANVIGLKAEQFAAIVREIAPLKPDLFEVNLSTPTFQRLIGHLPSENVEEAASIIKAVKAAAEGIPVFAKLTPNVPNIGEIAKACVAAGADGITAINTVGPGMAIDLKSRMPILAGIKGGLSGPALKPIAVRCVADCFAATEGKIPIIGTGGIYTGEDAIEMMMAGASLVGIGTAVSERGEDVFRKVCEEIVAWCEAEGVRDIRELVGAAHPLGKRTSS